MNGPVVLVGSFQTNYSFSRFLTLSSLIQVDTANTRAVSANIRLRWNYRPDSDMYVIYTAGTRFASLVAENPPQFYENRLAIKYSSRDIVSVSSSSAGEGTPAVTVPRMGRSAKW